MAKFNEILSGIAKDFVQLQVASDKASIEAFNEYLNSTNKSEENLKFLDIPRFTVSDVKMNLKGIYDTYECDVCLKDEESQKHIYECKEIWKIRQISHENISMYENILTGDVSEMIEVSQIIQANIKIQEKAKDTF